MMWTIHPFADEWLWAPNGTDPLLCPTVERAHEVAEAHRAERVEGAHDEAEREFMRGMWFKLCPEPTTEDIALVAPDGRLIRNTDALATYDLIDSSGRWPIDC